MAPRELRDKAVSFVQRTAGDDAEDDAADAEAEKRREEQRTLFSGTTSRRSLAGAKRPSFRRRADSASLDGGVE
jgi:hypothetical protein